MRAIYLDESATTTGDRYNFGALVVDADAARRIETGLNDVCALVARHTPGFNIDAELHGVDVFHGKKEWRTVLPAWRVKACELTVKCIRDSGVDGARKLSSFGGRRMSRFSLGLLARP